MTPQLRTLAEGLDHPESICLGPDGALFAGGEDGQIYRIETDGGHETIAHFPGRYFLGVAADAGGRLYLCDMNNAVVMRLDPATGESDDWCVAASGSRLVCPNTGAFNPDGSMWLTDSGEMGRPAGAIVLVPAGGGDGERLDLPPLHYPNACALGRGNMLYVAESILPGVTVIRDGVREVHRMLERTVPDGIAVTEDDTVLVGCFQPNAIMAMPGWGRPEGPVETIAEDWSGLEMLTPSGLAFFGPELDKLAISTVCGWSVRAFDELPFGGRPLVLPTHGLGGRL